MKQKTSIPTAQMEQFTQTRTTLFNSILGAETQHLIEIDIQKHAGRVGMILKVLHSRKLDVLRDAFETRLTELIRDTANSIDNELSATEENPES